MDAPQRWQLKTDYFAAVFPVEALPGGAV